MFNLVISYINLDPVQMLRILRDNVRLATQKHLCLFYAELTLNRKAS